MKSTIEKKEDGTITVTITIPQEEVKKTREEIIEQATKETTLPGFRKGKAPKKFVEDSLSQDKLREEILKKLLPQTYVQAVAENKINPVMHPKIHVAKVDDEKDWEFTATTCEAPKIDLGDYKKTVGKVTVKNKIVIPGKEEPFDSAQGKQQEPSFDEIMQALLKSVKVIVPDILLEGEVDRQLAQTLDEIKRLGLTLDQYLATSGKTPEKLRQEYTTKARNDVTIELVLQKIADIENITIEQKEIEEAIAKAKDVTERKNLEANRYLLANILRQQKTLDFLKHL